MHPYTPVLDQEFTQKKTSIECGDENEFDSFISTQKRQVLHLNLMSLSEINLGGGERRNALKKRNYFLLLLPRWI